MSPRGRKFLIGFLVTLVVFAVAWHFCFFQGCPDVHKLGAHVAGGAPVLVDRDGREYADLAPVEGELVELKALPGHVPDAFVAVEDKRFREHGAVDLRRVLGAIVANVKSGGVDEGSSTITMQLARNVFPDALPGQERTLKRKLLEVRVAYEIEREFSKDQILEMYLNHIYFGNGARGIEAAARHYFGKSSGKLALHEAALLAALPKAPTHYDPRRHAKEARERRDLVLSMMEEQGLVKPAAASAARKAGLGVVSRPRAARAAAAAAPVAAWLVDEVRREVEEHVGSDVYRERMKIHTTLDLDLQRAAEEELGRQLAAVDAGSLGAFKGPRYSAQQPAGAETTPYLQGAVVAVEARTGDVLAWVGGRDYRHSHFDRVKGARRQAGSAFKPFVYAAALDEGRTMNEPLSDEPLRITDGRRTWEPKNFDGRFDGKVTLRDALVRSKNVATVRLAQEVGISRVQKLAEEAGVEPPIPDQPSMALGTVSVSPIELAGAFTTFAALGERVTPRVVTKIERADGSVVWQADEPERKRVLDPAVAYLVTDALREALVRGTGQEVLQTGFRAPAAGKTGTTNDGADAWFVGYTPDVVAAVWVGFDERRPIMARATGGRLAAPVWARMMMRYQQKRPAAGGWAKPSNVIEGMVDPASGMLLAPGCAPFSGTAYRELFVSGRAPQTVCPSRGEVQMLEPWQLPPLPDIEEGMETGVPIEEIALEAPEGMPDTSAVGADPSAALPPEPSTAGLPPSPGALPGEPAGAQAGASPPPAPTMGYAPSSPRAPDGGVAAPPRPTNPAASPQPAEVVPSPRASASPAASPRPAPPVATTPSPRAASPAAPAPPRAASPAPSVLQPEATPPVEGPPAPTSTPTPAPAPGG